VFCAVGLRSREAEREETAGYGAAGFHGGRLRRARAGDTSRCGWILRRIGYLMGA
jgi:hypothetical protein